jgi:hypothetical protein
MIPGINARIMMAHILSMTNHNITAEMREEKQRKKQRKPEALNQFSQKV